MMRRLLLFLPAIALALCALVVPSTWGPLAEQLSAAGLFTGKLSLATPWHGPDAVLGPALPVPLVSQYQGIATDDVNCGPASVAAVLRYLRPDLAAMNPSDLVAATRAATGKPQGDTNLPGLAHALAAFGVSSAPLYASDAPHNAGDPLTAIRLALSHGYPVIATVGGVALGRGEQYGDHFVVMIGMDPQTETVDVIDPDTQSPGTAAWYPGGRQQWSATLARAALGAAQENDALALVAGATRTNVIPPATLLLAAAGALALLALLVKRRR